MLSIFSKRQLYDKHSQEIIDAFVSLKNNNGTTASSAQVNPFSGNNPFVLQMKEYLQKELIEDITDALVHGSIATEEEIPYSDFDALIVLKDEVFKNKKRLSDAAFKLGEARRIMQQMDPLQHHGWFVLTESLLKNLPVTYFPPVLFDFSRSMIHANTYTIPLAYSPGADFLKPFKNLCRSLTTKLQSGNPVRNAYAYKNLLSEFMLLPTLYVQARDATGIFKKFSFEEARKDFLPEQWTVMDEVSQIRLHWKYPVSGSEKRLYQSTHPLVKRLTHKWAFPFKDDNRLLPEQRTKMLTFVKLLELSIDKLHS
jgi:hypothetical protein